MDWENILILILGGAIGIVTNYFTNRYQLQRWREERDEQRRETKIQAKEDWIKRDIQEITDSINQVIKILSEFSFDFKHFDNFNELRKNSGLMSDEDELIAIKSLMDKFYDKGFLLELETNMLCKLIFSLEGGIPVEFKEFVTCTSDYLDIFIKQLQIRVTQEKIIASSEEATDKLRNIQVSAGKLHATLREKLISIRDTE